MVHSRAADCVACLPEALGRVVAADPGLAGIWGCLPRRVVARGDTLLRLGEVPAQLWWIQRGLVRFYFLASDGRERNKSFHAEGAWIGSGMPPRPTPSPYAIEALEETEVLTLSYGALSQALQRFAVVGEIHAQALGWAFAEQTAREAELLLEDATTRYRHFLRDRPGVAARVPLHHVASHLGITNVALSRIRRKLGLLQK